MFDLYVYILHSPGRCPARKPMCDKLADLLRVNPTFRAHVQFITDYEPDDGTMLPSVDYSPEPFKEHPELSGACVPLDVAQVSGCAKHRSALAVVAARANQGGYHMILEDDVLFGDSVVEQINAMLRTVPTDYDIVFTGLPSPVPSSRDDLTTARSIPLQQLFAVLPACDSYVVTPAAAATLAAAFSPVRLPPHLTLTWAIKKHGLRAYASSPNVFADGSKVGVYVSQVSPNNRLVWNEQFIRLEALANAPPPTDDVSMRAAQDLINSLQFKTHPDILRLIGRLQLRMGNYSEAETIFRQVHSVMTGEKCVMNAQSTFLRDYMMLHKFLQTA